MSGDVNVYIDRCSPAAGSPGGSGERYLYLAAAAFNGTLAMADATNLLQVVLDAVGFSTADFSGCTALTRFTCFDSAVLSSIDFSGCVALEVVSISGSGAVDTVDFTDCGALIGLTINESNLTALDLTEVTALQFLTAMDNSSLAAIDITGNPLLIEAYLSGNALDETNVDGVLVALDGFGESNGTVDLSGGTNSIPSATGLSAKASLEGKGWTVTVNS